MLESDNDYFDSINVCPECGNIKLIKDYQRAEIICFNCGLVIRSKMIDMGPEWRAFDGEQREKRGRVGSPTTLILHDKGLSTMIDWRNKDSFGNDINPRKRAQISRLRKWQRRIRISDATERNLAFALSEMDRISSYLGLSRNVREAAAMLYRQAVNQRLIRGRSIEGVTAAAIYAACRKCKVPRTLDEIAGVSQVGKKDIGRGYRFIARELAIKVPPTNPIDYIPRFSSELKLNGNVQSRAVEILKQAIKFGLTSGRGPTGVAAAAIYVASVIENERRTQRDIAEVTKITEVTVRNRYKELIELLHIPVP